MCTTRQGRTARRVVVGVLLCSLGGELAQGGYECFVVGSVGEDFGRSVSMDGDYAIIGAPVADCAYVYYNDPNDGENTWAKQAALTVSDAPDGFGSCVAISGDTAVVSSVGRSDAGDTGSIWEFQREDSDWTLVEEYCNRYLSSSPFGPWVEAPVSGEEFGASLATDGETIVVGAPAADDSTGQVHVFPPRQEWVSIFVWTTYDVLVASDGAPGDRFGESVSVKGDTIVVGAPGHSGNGPGSGAVYVFERDDDGSWHEQQKLLGQPNSAFGSSVCTTGGTLVVGAPDMEPAGEVRVYNLWFYLEHGGLLRRSWKWDQTLEPWEVSGRTLHFGSSVCLDGDLLVVGAPTSMGDDSFVADEGDAYLFTRRARPLPWIPPYGDYEPCTILHAEGDAWAQHFACSVATNGDWALVGQDAGDLWVAPYDEAVFYYDFTCDATASISINPSPSYNFGTVVKDGSAVKAFTISSTGNLDVRIQSIVSSSPHFVVENAPTGQNVPPDATFDVEFLAGNIAGTHTATMTLKGTSAAGSLEAAITVSGTTAP